MRMKMRNNEVFVDGKKVALPIETQTAFGTVVLKYSTDCNGVICGSVTKENGEKYHFGIYSDGDHIITENTCSQVLCGDSAIRTVLDELKIHQIVLFEMEVSESEIVEERIYDNRHSPNGRRTNAWYTDGTRKFIRRKDNPDGGWIDTISITGWTYIFNVEFGNPRRRGSETYVDKIMLTPECEPRLLKENLARY